MPENTTQVRLDRLLSSLSRTMPRHKWTLNRDSYNYRLTRDERDIGPRMSGLRMTEWLEAFVLGVEEFAEYGRKEGC